MLVNVITRHGPANYGSLLQTIATQHIINKMGYDCQIIDYIPKCESTVRIAFTLLKGKKEWNESPVKRLLYLAMREPENILMYKKFAAMKKKYLVLGSRCSSEYELRNLYKTAKGNTFMTGSDQVWGPISTGTYDPAYFLTFAPEGARKIAFASSFGKSSFDEETLNQFRNYLNGYDAIAVRENIAVDIIHRMGMEAEQVLDPTLLLSEDEWSEFISSINKPKEYVLVYQIHNNPKLDKYAEQLAQYVNLPLLRVSPMLHQVKRSGKFIYLPDIGDFLDLIKHATYMVTDSFHGTAFAINFNVQFVEVLPNTGTSGRNQSILELTGLEGRVIRDLNNFHYIDTQIDFAPVNDIINQEKSKSISILKQYLSD